MGELDVVVSLPALVAGAAVGAVALAPLARALAPVVRGSKNLSMTRGALGIGASFALMLAGVLVVHLMAGEALVSFAVGEVAAFLLGAFVVTVVIMVRHGG